MARISILIGATVLCGALAMPAGAAEPVVEAGEPVRGQRVFSWSGPYIGAHIAYAWGLFDTDVAGGDIEGSGAIGGVLAGYNWQVDQFVVGVEGDWSATDFRGNRSAPPIAMRGTADWLASLRARAGIAFDRYLVYGTGGVAFSDIELAGFGSGGTQGGWTIGAGIEGAVSDNVTARIEYSFTGFPARNHALGGAAVRSDLDLHAIRAGIVYKFDMF